MILAALALPYPPSVNAIWQPTPVLRVSVGELRAKLAAGVPWRKLITAKVHSTSAATKYRAQVAASILRARLAGDLGEQPLLGTLDVRVIAHPPPLDRRRDTDNLWKALLDGMTFAEVVLDDSQFVDNRIRWGDPRLEAFVRVVIGRPERTEDDDFLGLEREAERVQTGRALRDPDLTQARLL